MTNLKVARGEHRLEVLARFNAVEDIVDAGAADDPDALAVLSRDAAGDVVAAQPAADLARASREAARTLLDPREIRFVEELPKTIRGKIRSSELCGRLADLAEDDKTIG